MGVVVYSRISVSVSLDQIEPPMCVGQASAHGCQARIALVTSCSEPGRVGHIHSIYSLLIEKCHLSRGRDEVEILILT